MIPIQRIQKNAEGFPTSLPCWDKGDEFAKAYLWCDKGHCGSLRTHTISADGTVSPSAVCPRDGCGFHQFIKLVGWVGLILIVLMSGAAQAAVTNKIATITITNASVINGTNGAALVITNANLSLDTRTWTNSVISPTTQILARTNIASDAQELLIHVGEHPFANNVRVYDGDNLTYVRIQGTNAFGVFIKSNWATVTWATQLFGVPMQTMNLPVDGLSPAGQTNVATKANDALNHAGNLSRTFTDFHGVGGWGWNLASVTVSNGNNYLALSGTNTILRLTGATTNWNVPGISNGFSGRMIGLLNMSGQTLTITNQCTLAGATNRVITGSTNATILNNALALLFYDGVTNRWLLFSGGGGGGSGSGGGGADVDLEWGNSVWVDATFGDDATGTRTNASKPFATLEVAKTNALAGDTVFVRPGVYNPAVGLMKSNVNWHFFNGTIVTNTGSSMALFDDYDGVNYTNMGTVNVTGDGEFYDSGSYGVIASQHSGTRLTVECRIIKTHGNTIAVYQGEGNTTIHAKDMITGASTTSGGIIQVDGGTTGGGTITINNSRIVSNRTNANAAAIIFGSAVVANTNTFLRDCVIVCQPAVTNTITGPSGSAVRIYGSLMAAPTTNYSTISILTGATRFEAGDVK